MASPRLVVEAVSRAFGPTQALAAVSLTVQAGEVHALLGENGAGKSTLMAIVSGAERADAGQLELNGVPYQPQNPGEARASGVHMVHQEPHLCADLTVAENLFLGSEPVRYGWVRRQALLAQARQALSRVTSASNPIDPTTLVSKLSPSQRQLVAIARALAQPNCRLLILDEPTASLSQADVAALFEAIREVSQAGVSVIYISHFLEEVGQIAVSYTVLRDGVNVATGDIAETSPKELIQKMAGRKLGDIFVHTERQPGPLALRVTDLCGEKLPKGASLELFRGEILGISGLLGAGRSELLRGIFGLTEVRSGDVLVGAFTGGVSPKTQIGKVNRAATPAQRLAQGLGLLSEDRKQEGISQKLSVAENLTLSRLSALGAFGYVSSRRQLAVVADWIARLGIVCQGPLQRASELSGGNQQKVAFARLLYHNVDVLLLDEPTRGIDVRSRGEIYRLMDAAAREGKAVLMVSSYLPELLGVCDRIQVMRHGKLGEARRASALNEHDLLAEAMLNS